MRLQKPYCARLQLQSLEQRDVPAGIVEAEIVGGVLTIKGDDADNDLTIRFEANQVVLTPDLTTDVGAGPGLPFPVPGGVPTSLKATMKGGDDFIRADAVADFILAGNATFDLGDGRTNTLFLNTTGKIDLGSLTVLASDSFDEITIDGSAASQIRGNVSFNLGNDGSDLLIQDAALNGTTATFLTATGADEIDFINVTGDIPFKATFGLGGGEIRLDNAKLGSITASSETLGWSAANASTTGDIKLSGIRSVNFDSNLGTYGAVTLNVKAHDASIDANVLGGIFNGDMIASGKGISTSINGELDQADMKGSVIAKQSGSSSLTNFNVLNGSKIAKNLLLSATGANTDLNSEVNGSDVLGSISLISSGIGDSDTVLNLNGTVNSTAVTILGYEDADLDTNAGSSITLTGDLRVTAKTLGAEAEIRGSFKANNFVFSGGQFGDFEFIAGSTGILTGKITVLAKESARAHVRSTSSLTLPGEVKLQGALIANLVSAGIYSSGKVSMKSSNTLVDVQTGTFTVNGDLLATGTVFMDADFTPNAASTIKGRTSIIGGIAIDDFRSNANMKFEKDLFIDLKDGTNDIIMTGVVGTPTVGGKLTINTISGNDDVDLTNVSVTGLTSINTGAGVDDVSVDGQSIFTGAVTINTGSGDDTLDVGSANGETGPVTFTSTLLANLGTGNDTLQLGSVPGDANTRVDFTVPGSKIDGGLGLNSFDDEDAQITNLANLTTLSFTDPTPP